MRCVIYTRVSVDKREGRSVTEQETEARQVAEAEGWQVVQVFTDNDRSASRYATKVRKGYAALLAHLAAEPVDVLILWEPSRGDRELESWAGLLNLCRRRGTRIHVVTHHRTYDLAQPRDWRTLAEDGVDSAYESEKTRERIMRNVRANAVAGRPHGKLQFGYTRVYDDRGRFVEQIEHPEQAPLVREAARRVLAGESCNSIAADFNARGIAGPTGGRWDLTQVKRLCVMPSYAGLRQHQGQVVGKAAWKGIHDEATYAKLLARLTDPKRRTQRDSALKHVLSGLIRCALCESVMQVLKNRGYLCYTCKGCMRTSVRTVSVEGFVEELVMQRLERDDAADLFATPDRSEETTAAERELAELEDELEQWRALAKARKVSPASFAEFELDLLPRIEQAKARTKAPAPVPEQIRELIGAPRERWPALTIYQRRETIGLLIAELRVSPVGRGKRVFDPHRLGRSRWTGDTMTWAEHLEAENLAVMTAK